ncbi:MAG: tRNA uridine-5-carboxymethylaminomethyl(34) synthesis GTPase MnmE [Clostridiaceae bacterium]
MLKEKTIAGIATSVSISSISVIRLSGPDSLSIASDIFGGVNNRPLSTIKPFTIRYGHIKDGEATIDEVLVSYFKGPKSYTGEEVVEISCHGGPLPVRKILDLLIRKGAYLAEPGEFTKRAFLNGRIDLSQAEAVMDIINSRTDAALRSANEQSRGDLSGRISNLRSILLNVMAEIEVTLDFPDDELERKSDLALANKLEAVRYEIEKLLSTAETGRIVREGIKVVIAGKPNVGKSSLLNALLNENRAIVTNIPGTTRDIIEEFINIDGIPVRLVDTAGIRETSDEVESIGVERSRRNIEEADLVILVLDQSRELSEEDLELMELTNKLNRITLINKQDLPTVAEIPEKVKDTATIISASNGFGLEEVRNRIRDMILKNMTSLSEVMITASRHKEALIRCEASLEESIAAIENMTPMDLVTIDVNDAWQALGEITGDTLREDLVDKIFSGFCIGK